MNYNESAHISLRRIALNDTTLAPQVENMPGIVKR